MKLNAWKKLVKGLIFAALLTVTSAGVLTITAQAQDRDRDRDHRWQRNERRDRDWNRQRNDWDRERRERERARDLERIRERNAYRYRYNYPRQYPYYDYGNRGRYNWSNIQAIAEQQGYRDGFERGSDDARHRRSFNLYDSGRFRDGDRGYHSEYGSKDFYRVSYREGFRRGYEQGYRQYAGYRRW